MFAYFVVIPHENKFQSKAAAGGNGFVQGFLYDIMDIIVWEAAGVLLAAMKELLIMENEIRQNTDWLKELADDASLWEERAYEEMPAVIAHEYKRLHELAKDGNVYGTMLQLRDVFELSLKYPFLIGLCILQSSGNSEAGALYREFMSKFFSESMTLGKWFESVRKLNEQNQYLPEALAKIIKKTISLYGNNHVIGEYHGVINWRNDTIGHGALRLEADEAIRSEMRALLQMLKNYFNQYLRKIYGRCVLKQGDKVLIGYAAATEHQNNQMPFSIEIQYENGDKIPPLQDLKYVLNIDDNIGFFDSYIRNKNSSKYLDYVTGHHKLNAKDFFYELYRELRECGMVKVTQDFSREKTDDMIERMLNELEKSYHFVVPRYAYNWLDEKIKYMTKGCFMLRMGRGMGKSTLTAHLDGRYLDRDYEKYIEDDCIIRTYHCSRNQVRDFDDFIMNLNTMFLEADGMKNRITDIKKKFKMIDTEQADETERATAELLNSCKQELGKKIVLIIDGVDEIIDRKIFDFLPHSTNLDDGIYVFYTSRPEDEISDESLGERINGIFIDDERCILPDDKEFRGVLSEYAKNLLKDAKKKRKESIAEDYEHLAERAGYNFLNVQFLISLYGSGETVDAALLASEYDMFGHYLDYLRRQYMEKFFVIRMLPILVVLSIFSNGLTFREISILLDDRVDNDLILLASLNDLKGVLSVERSDKGNVYKLANESYVSYVQEKYANDIRQCRQELIEELLQSVEDYDVDFCWNNKAFLEIVTSETDSQEADSQENEQLSKEGFSIADKQMSVEKFSIVHDSEEDGKSEQNNLILELILRKYILFLSDEDFESKENIFDIAWAWLLLVARMGQVDSSLHDNAIMSVNFRWIKRVLMEAAEKSLDEKIAWAWFYYYVYPAIIKVEAKDDEVVNSKGDVEYFKNLISGDVSELFLMMTPGEESTAESQLLRYCKKLMDSGLIRDVERFLLMLAQCYRLGKLARNEKGTLFYIEEEEVTGEDGDTYIQKKERENPYRNIFYKYVSSLATDEKATLSDSRFIGFCDIGAFLETINKAVKDVFGQTVSISNASITKLIGHYENYCLNNKLNRPRTFRHFFGIRGHEFAYSEIKLLVDRIARCGESPQYWPAKYYVNPPIYRNEYSFYEEASISYRNKDSFHELANALLKDDEKGYYSLLCMDYSPFHPRILPYVLKPMGRRTKQGKAMIAFCSEEFEKLLEKMQSALGDGEKLKELFDNITNRTRQRQKIESIPFFDFFKKIKYKDLDSKEMLSKFKEWIDEFSDVPVLQMLYIKQYRKYVDEMVRLEEWDGLFDALLYDGIWQSNSLNYSDKAYYLAYGTRYFYGKGQLDKAKKVAKKCINFIRRPYENSANVDVLPKNGYMDEWAVCHHVLANIHDSQPEGDAYYIFDRMMPTDGEDKRSNKYILQAASSYFNHIIMAEILGDVNTIKDYVDKLSEFLTQLQKQELPIVDDDHFSEISDNVQMCIWLYNLRIRLKDSYTKESVGDYLVELKNIAQFIVENQFSIKLQFIVLFISLYKKAVPQSEYEFFEEFEKGLRDSFALYHEYDLIAKYSVSFEDFRADMNFPSRGWDFPSYEDDAPPKCDSIFFTVDGFTIDTSDEE